MWSDDGWDGTPTEALAALLGVCPCCGHEECVREADRELEARAETVEAEHERDAVDALAFA